MEATTRTELFKDCDYVCTMFTLHTFTFDIAKQKEFAELLIKELKIIDKEKWRGRG